MTIKVCHNEVKFDGDPVKKPYCDNSKRWLDIKLPKCCPHIRHNSDDKCIGKKCEYYTHKVINKYYMDTMRYGDQWVYKADHYKKYKANHRRTKV